MNPVAVAVASLTVMALGIAFRANAAICARHEVRRIRCRDGSNSVKLVRLRRRATAFDLTVFPLDGVVVQYARRLPILSVRNS